MYGLFKENGPYLVGWDVDEERTFLVPNKFSWTENHHMLYIDNPVGAGFRKGHFPILNCACC
jgi:vitellogenic carboxypeptidase-like protein